MNLNEIWVELSQLEQYRLNGHSNLLEFIQFHLDNNKFLLNLLNKTINSDSWDFYRFHLLFTLLYWNSKN